MYFSIAQPFSRIVWVTKHFDCTKFELKSIFLGKQTMIFCYYEIFHVAFGVKRKQRPLLLNTKQFWAIFIFISVDDRRIVYPLNWWKWHQSNYTHMQLKQWVLPFCALPQILYTSIVSEDRSALSLDHSEWGNDVLVWVSVLDKPTTITKSKVYTTNEWSEADPDCFDSCL